MGLIRSIPDTNMPSPSPSVVQGSQPAAPGITSGVPGAPTPAHTNGARARQPVIQPGAQPPPPAPAPLTQLGGAVGGSALRPPTQLGGSVGGPAVRPLA